MASRGGLRHRLSRAGLHVADHVEVDDAYRPASPAHRTRDQGSGRRSPHPFARSRDRPEGGPRSRRSSRSNGITPARVVPGRPDAPVRHHDAPHRHRRAGPHEVMAIGDESHGVGRTRGAVELGALDDWRPDREVANPRRVNPITRSASTATRLPVTTRTAFTMRFMAPPASPRDGRAGSSSGSSAVWPDRARRGWSARPRRDGRALSRVDRMSVTLRAWSRTMTRVSRACWVSG